MLDIVVGGATYLLSGHKKMLTCLSKLETLLHPGTGKRNKPENQDEDVLLEGFDKFCNQIQYFRIFRLNSHILRAGIKHSKTVAPFGPGSF